MSKGLTEVRWCGLTAAKSQQGRKFDGKYAEFIYSHAKKAEKK